MCIRPTRDTSCLVRTCAVWSVVPVGTRERQAAVTGLRLDQQRLVDVNAARLEGVCRASHVESPGAVGRLIGQGARRVVTCFEAPHPMPERQRVVLAQAL